MTRILIHKIFHTLFVVIPMSSILTFLAVMKNLVGEKDGLISF